MTRYLIVTSRALPGREEEYRTWYLGTHIGEVLQVPGFRSGRLHSCVAPNGEPTGEFKALYEVDPEIAPGALMGELQARAANMDLTDAIDQASVDFTFLFPE